MVQLELVKQWLEESMVFSPLYLLLLLFPILYFVKLYVQDSSKALKLPPSPPKLPIVGNLHQISEQPHRSFHELSKKYGPVMLLHFGSSKVVVISSPDIAREATTSLDIDLAYRPPSTAIDIIAYGSSSMVFAPYGDYWKFVKNMLVQELLSKSRVNSLAHVREEQVAKMMEQISSSCLKQIPVNLSEMLRYTTNRIVCRSTGIENEKIIDRCGELARKAMVQLFDFAFGDLFPSLIWLDHLTSYRWKRTFKQLDSVLENILQDRESKGISNADDKDLLDHLLQALVQNHISRDNVKAMIVNVMVGGGDTAIPLEWTVAELFNKPSAMKKVQEEVRRVVGTKSKMVLDKDLEQMHYLKSVVKEILRLHAPAPLMMPRFTSTGIKLNGYDIPPNTTVLVNVWEFHRDPEVWDNPEEFIPERWLNKTIDFTNHKCRFLPFGTGRRGCPGMSMGLPMFELVLANILYCFDWKLPDESTKMDMTQTYGAVTKKEPVRLVPVLPSFLI